MEDNLLTIDEAADRMGISKNTVRRRIKKGDLRAVKMPGQYGEQYFIPENEVADFAVPDVVPAPASRQLTLNDLENFLDQLLDRKNQPAHSAIEAMHMAMQAMHTAMQAMQQELATTKELLNKQNRAHLLAEEERQKAEAERERLAQKRDRIFIEKVRELINERRPWWRLFKKWK